MINKTWFHRFDPARVAHLERANYLAYYRRQWFTLLRVSIALVREAFGFTGLDALHAAYLIARAEIAFATFPKNNPRQAEHSMRRFYAFLNARRGSRIDVDRAARLDVRWWQIHRDHFAADDFAPLSDALADWLAEVYGLEREQVLEAARRRAYGILRSDRWVRDGMPEPSALLDQEVLALTASYAALLRALAAGPEPNPAPAVPSTELS
ncbi:MAG TPA: hypothetical protein PLC98_02735 [Anaerolineales bacterium]|nr:hypothetical protein [Anaerolineales bacterium]